MDDENKPIGINDLVYMYRGCTDSCNCSALGAFFVVTSIERIELTCGGGVGRNKFEIPSTLAASGLNQVGYSGKPCRIPVSWLKRVPRMPELRDEQIKEVNT